METLSRLPYVDAVVSESLRKYPPAFLTQREITAAEYRIPELDLTLPKGTFLVIPIYALHHCDQFFPHPDQFDPDRFLPENRHQIAPYSYLPFGAGPRNCIGMKLALDVTKKTIAAMSIDSKLFRSRKQ